MRIVYLAISIAFLMSCSEDSKPSENTDTKQSETEQSTTNPQENLKPEPASDAPETIEVKTEDGKTKTVSANKPKEVKKIETGWKGNNELPTDEIEPVQEEVKMIKPNFSGVFNQILKNFVSSSGKVNYVGIKTNKEMLNQAAQYYEENTPQSSWSNNKKLAYWINAYNLYTIKLVVDNYPVKSIKDIAGGKPWDKKFIKLDGRSLSLNDIENGIIRKDFNEPRIHFAVNCASISCPKLLNKEFTASNLNSLLQSQTKRFVNDNSMNSLNGSSAEISNIFNWYKVDFVKSGTVIDFINKYANAAVSSDASITYKDYNWNLNK